MATDLRSPDAERELAGARAEAAEAWGRYHELRNRRVVRAALWLASLRARLARRRTGATEAADPAPAADPAAPVLHCWEIGHYYSPVPDSRALAREPTASRIWPVDPVPSPGIEWRDAEQLALVTGVLGRQEPMRFPAEPTGNAADYHTGNPMFSALDAWALQALLRHLRPARVIEVGCGFSSLVTARVNREHLGGELDFTCIEPYPPAFLASGVEGITRLIESPVQDVPLERFDALRAADVLFIDTAHVAKTGGDVNRLYHEVLPRLAPGVVVHVHDIFFPHDYPREWVLGGRGWNEQYLLQSFLAFNDAFEVVLGNAWMAHFHPEALAAAAPDYPRLGGGGSFWMRRR